MQCIYFPKLGMPVLEPSSHRPTLIALLSTDEDSHPQIKKRVTEDGFSGNESPDYEA